MVPFDARDMSPYPGQRYAGSSSAVLSQPYGSPTRKKPRREDERYFSGQSMSASPPRRHPPVPLHPESHMSHRAENVPTALHHRHRRDVPPGHSGREKHSYDERTKHHARSPGMPSNHSKEGSIKAPYSNEGNSRYRSSSPVGRYPMGASKSYGPTLHERFSSVVESSRSEPRVQYSREDLEKITIDIRRPVREPSPTLRHIVNPSDVKLVRRANEGHRPIFDREEIKQAPRDMREDAYYERKKTGGTYSSMRGIDLREVENYQITRHRFDSQHDIFSSSSGKTLNDRWQNPEGRKESMSLDRDEREKEYERNQASKAYAVSRNRSRSGDRDFRSEKYLDAKSSHGRSEYPSRPPPNIPESRNSVPYPHRKSTVPIDARHKLNIRKGDREGHPSSIRPENKGHFHPHSDRHYPENVPSSRIERREHHSPVPESQKWNYKSRSPNREKMDYQRRPEKLGYKSWNEKPNMPPKGPNYFEHENRQGSSSFHARGNSRPFQNSRGGFRGRGFRGMSRGSSFFRGSFRGGYRPSSSPRGRGPPRR